MSTYYVAYLGILCASLLFSLWAARHDAEVWILTLLLALAVLTEATVYVMYYLLALKPQFFAVYHIYIPFEFALLSLYFSRHVHIVLVKKIIAVAIPVFAVCSVWLTYQNGLFTYPGNNLNLEGFLIIIWAVISLFSIQPKTDVSLFKLPVFWMSVGVLLYYSGGFFFNFVYQYISSEQSEIVRRLNELVNKGLNFVLYTFMIISFVCSNRLSKSSRQ